MKRKNAKESLKSMQIVVAGAVVILAATIMAGIYTANENKDQERARLNQIKELDSETENNTEVVSNVIKPKNPVVTKDESKDLDVPQNPKKEEPKEPDAKEAGALQTLKFEEGSKMSWPVQGEILMKYSMDKSIYYATLDQYQYNPALVIKANPGDKVNCAAAGKITDISTNENTGCTVTMDIGSGYVTTYGQIKSPLYKKGDYVKKDACLGYIAEPTKYYSVEGSNLYFKVEKDKKSIDPTTLFEENTEE